MGIRFNFQSEAVRAMRDHIEGDYNEYYVPTHRLEEALVIFVEKLIEGGKASESYYATEKHRITITLENRS